MKPPEGTDPRELSTTPFRPFERRQSHLPFQGVSDLGLMSRDKIWMEVKGAGNLEVS